jgi:peptidoglycan/xylan/chitin deacetylase (PgdA/CDA1 family)
VNAARSQLLSRRALFGLGLGAAALGFDLARGDDVAAVALSGVTGTVNIDTLNLHSHPSSSRPVVGQLTGGAVVACLTFDAGSDRGNAAAILDILAAKQVSASFGITGH